MKNISSILQKKIKSYVKARSELVVSRSILLHQSLHPYSKIIYLVFSSLLQNAEDTVQVTHRSLRTYSKLSQSSVSRSLKELSAFKLIKIQRQGNKKNNIYKIL